jgi:hypothetical protein
MAGILDLTGAAPRGGLLGGLNDNAILGYLAGALQGGNVGQSIGRGLEGWMQGTRLDEQRRVPAQTYAALAAAGVPDALAKAAALNPSVMKAVAPGYFDEKAHAPGQTPIAEPDGAARAAPRAPDTAAVAALNTAVGRLGDFMRAADDWSDASPPAPAASTLTHNAAGIAQALRASGIGDGELRALAQTLESSRSPAEFKAAVGRTLDLLGARLEQLQAQFRRGATAPPALLSPRANATLEKLRQWSAGTSMPGTPAVGGERGGDGMMRPAP